MWFWHFSGKRMTVGMTPMAINSDEYFTEYCIRLKYIFILLFSVCFLNICFVLDASGYFFFTKISPGTSRGLRVKGSWNMELQQP